MAEGNFLSKSGDVISFFLRIIYRLTVKLTVEFLKIGTLLAIVINAAVFSGLAFIYCAIWAYTTSGGSLLISACACGVATLVFVALFWLLQVLVKDVLRLTDLTLPELAKLIVTAPFKKGKDKNASQKGKVD